jgi:hypothetical protein
MLGLFHRKRIHEPVAIGAVIASAVSLNAFWILNLLSARVVAVWDLLNLNPELGSITGLALASSAVYLLTWAIVALLLRGRDCSDYRDRAFWFLIVSIFLFLIFSFPAVYGFSLGSL